MCLLRAVQVWRREDQAFTSRHVGERCDQECQQSRRCTHRVVWNVHTTLVRGWLTTNPNAVCASDALMVDMCQLLSATKCGVHNSFPSTQAHQVNATVGVLQLTSLATYGMACWGSRVFKLCLPNTGVSFSMQQNESHRAVEEHWSKCF